MTAAAREIDDDMHTNNERSLQIAATLSLTPRNHPQHTTISQLMYPIPSALGSQTLLSLRSTLEGDHGGNASVVCFLPFCCIQHIDLYLVKLLVGRLLSASSDSNTIKDDIMLLCYVVNTSGSRCIRIVDGCSKLMSVYCRSIDSTRSTTLKLLRLVSLTFTLLIDLKSHSNRDSNWSLVRPANSRSLL